MKGKGGATDMDRSCMPIRRSEVPKGIRDMAISDWGPRPALKRAFLGSLGKDMDDRTLLLVHEAMVLSGNYRNCLEPLKRVLERSHEGAELTSYVLARAGIAALEHGLPLDMRPINVGLGLDVGNRGRFRRGGGDPPLISLMKELLRALLLNDRSTWVESEGLAKDLTRGSDRAFSKALIEASRLAREDHDQGVYYELKALLMMGRSLASTGDYLGGKDRIANVAKKAKSLSFPALEMSACQEMGALSESVAEAEMYLERAMDLAKGLHNLTEWKRSRIMDHLIVCREADLTPEGRSRILDSSREMAGLAREMMDEDPHYSMDALANAALWMGRTGTSDEAIDILRGLLKDLKALPDEDLEMKVLATGVLAHMKAGDRQKGKRALLSLITRKPVKNHPEAFSILKEAVSDQGWLREDKETSQLFSEERVYLLERSAAQEIIRRAKEAYPNEFGAMLRGIERITHIEPVFEGAEGRSSFMFSMFNRFSQRMVEGEGVVHSHPSGAAYPSGADLAMFNHYPGINIIIGYPYSEDSMAAYDRLGNRVMLRIVPDGG